MRVPLFLVLSGCLGTDALVPATVDDDPSLPSLEIGDTRLRIEHFGDVAHPLVVVLHGGPGSDYDGLLPLAALVEEGHQVLFYDQRGAGLSRRHDAGTITAARHVGDLDALVNRYAPDGTATLVGHSWGGQLAAAMAQAHPDRVDQLVFLEPGPFTGARWTELGLQEVDMTATHLNDLFWSEQMVGPDSHARLDWHFQQLLSEQLAGYAFREEDPMPFQRMGFVGYRDVIADTLVDGVATWDFRPDDVDWTGRAHFLWGGANTLMDDAYRREQEADWPGSTTRTFPGAGHDLPWVETEAVLAHLREVL